MEASLLGWGTNGYDPAGELMVVFEGERSSLQDLNPSGPAPPDFAAWDPATGEIVDELDGLVAAIWTTPGTLAGAWTDGTVGDSYDVRRHTRAPGPPDQGGVVHVAGLTAGGTHTYVEGHFDDGSDGRCELWSVDVATRQFTGPVIDVGTCPPVGSASASASADGARVAFTYPGPGGWATDVYDGRSGEKLSGPLHGQFTAAIGPDGTLYGGDVAGKVTQYDPETLEPIGTFPQARGRVEALEFDADGRLLLVGSANQNVAIYDVATRSRIGDPVDTGRPIVGGNAGPVLRPDGKAVAVNGRDGLAVWNIEPDRLAEAACRLAGRNLTRSELEPTWATSAPIAPPARTSPEPAGPAVWARMRGVPFRFFRQTIAILTSASESNGVVGAVEVAGPGGAVPPLHVHRREDEAFYVLDGEYSVFVGDDVITASLGSWVWGPRDVPHGYQVNSERGRHLSLMLPGGFEAFFEEVAAIATPDAEPRREMNRIAAVAARYGVELVGSPPAPT